MINYIEKIGGRFPLFFDLIQQVSRYFLMTPPSKKNPLITNYFLTASLFFYFPLGVHNPA